MCASRISPGLRRRGASTGRSLMPVGSARNGSSSTWAQTTCGSCAGIWSPATSKSWWDTVDSLDRTVGDVIRRFPDARPTILEWARDENVWVRRIAIDHQLLRKGDTDTELLADILQANFGSGEFFIDKAIGWALRDYSKTSPEWVRGFIEDHRGRMSALSIR